MDKLYFFPNKYRKKSKESSLWDYFYTEGEVYHDTGCKDILGKSIYEGDTVTWEVKGKKNSKYPTYIHKEIVRYDVKSAGFLPKHITSGKVKIIN